MKKAFLAVLFILLLAPVFAQDYQINYVSYQIQGCGAPIFGITQDYAVARAVPVDKKRVFNDKAELDAYLEDYKKKLNNLRAFETITVDYTFEDPDAEHMLVNLIVTLKDSFHLFAIPGPKYDSNTGLIFKLKIKDSNFLGSLNTLSSDFYFLLPTDESDASHSEFGFNASIDYPFKLASFDATWLNDLGISYTFGNDMPEWNVSTGLRFYLPVSKHSLVFEAKQKFINNFAYEEFEDNIYFANDFGISMPLKIAEMNYFGSLLYTPYISTTINYDHDGISKMNSSLSSPSLTGGHKLSFGRIDWSDNLRTGLTVALDNYYTYNFQRQRFYPVIELKTAAYKKIDLIEDSFTLRNIGLATDFHAFTFMTNPKKNKYIYNDGKSIGQYLRGIRDNQEYKGTDISSLNLTTALIFNFDFPIQILRTNFKNKFFKYFNFDMQLSPFFDMALTYNKITQKLFDFKDGFYGAGLEVIVYPLKWSGITIRGSVGIDVGRKFFDKNLNMDWRQGVSKKEFSVGFGLHY